MLLFIYAYSTKPFGKAVGISRDVWWAVEGKKNPAGFSARRISGCGCRSHLNMPSTLALHSVRSLNSILIVPAFARAILTEKTPTITVTTAPNAASIQISILFSSFWLRLLSQSGVSRQHVTLSVGL